MKNKKIIKFPPFISLPMEIYLNLNLSDGAMRLFYILNLYQNDDKGCYASNSYLSKISCMDTRSVTRNISLLEKYGYIIIKNKKSTSKRKIFINNYKELYKNPIEELIKFVNSKEKYNYKKQREIFSNILGEEK